MNAARYYKFLLNWSPVILNRHQPLASTPSEAQGNTSHDRLSQRHLHTQRSELAGWGNSQSIPAAGGSPRAIPKHAPSDAHVLKASTRRRSCLFCYPERKEARTQTAGAAGTRTVHLLQTAPRKKVEDTANSWLSSILALGFFCLIFFPPPSNMISKWSFAPDRGRRESNSINKNRLPSTKSNKS